MLRHRCVTPVSLARLFVVLAAASAPALGDTHLLLTEAVLTPSTDEFIEIGNPTTSPVPLGNYYLCDDADYALLPGQFGAGPAPQITSSDFMARFPMRDVLPAGGIIVVAIDGAGYSDTFGSPADYEVLGTDPATPDLLEAYPGSIGFLSGLANGGEGVTIFRWDGLSDLVDDVDMIRLGVPAGLNDIASKTGLAVDGPDAGGGTTTYLNDALSMPVQPATAGIGLSTKRISLELLREVHNGGNGITGDDETTEDIEVTWDSSFTVPTPGFSSAIDPPSGVVLSVAKTGEATVNAGQEMTYTIFVQNSGTDPAFNVLVTDTLPAGLTFVSEVSPPAVNNFDTIEPDISWVAGALAAGNSFTIDLTVLVDIGFVGNAINHVAVFTTSLDDDPADNTSSHVTTVIPGNPELSVDKIGPATAIAGQDIDYTLIIENTGNAPTDDVFLTDTLPNGFSFVGETSPGGVFIIDVTPPELVWDVGTVGPGEMITIDLTARIPLGVDKSVDNTAEVTTSTATDDPIDNIDIATTIVSLPAPDVSVTKAGPAAATSGTNIVYTLELRNNSNGPASDLIMTDTLPPGLTFVSESSPPFVNLVDSIAPTIVWDAGTFSGNQTATIDLTVAIDLAVSGDIVNDVDITTTSPGDDPGDNFDSAVTNVTIPPPAIAITKTTDAKAFQGMELVYTIVVENTGLGPADDVVITDTLPAGLTFVSESSPPSVTLIDMTEPTISWNAGTIGPGATVMIDLTAAIDVGVLGMITNDVIVLTSSPGDNPADNADSATTNVLELLPMLELTKTGPASAVNGTEITYTMFVQNTGNGAAETVRIADTLPAGVTFVSESSPGSVSFNNPGGNMPVWTVGTLTPFATSTVMLTVAIDTGFTGTLVNSAEVTTTTPNEDPADNIDTATTFVTDPGGMPDGLVINEIRTRQPDTDKDEYFELKGEPGMSLDNVTYLVIGDTTGDIALGDSPSDGGIEEVTNLSGRFIQPDGLFFVAESSFTLDPGAVVDLETNLNFENSDNVTHLLVFEFTGSNGDDLDFNDDGILDDTPWTAVIDAIGMVEDPNPPSGTEWAYGASLGFEDIGPDGSFVPAHVYRCDPLGTWSIGSENPAGGDAVDTPDGVNEQCSCPSDTNGDGDVNIDDVVNVVLCFGTNGAGCPTSGDRTDVDGSGTVDIDDIVQIVLNLGPCP